MIIMMTFRMIIMMTFRTWHSPEDLRVEVYLRDDAPGHTKHWDKPPTLGLTLKDVLTEVHLSRKAECREGNLGGELFSHVVKNRVMYTVSWIISRGHQSHSMSSEWLIIHLIPPAHYQCGYCPLPQFSWTDHWWSHEDLRHQTLTPLHRIYLAIIMILSVYVCT